MVAGIGRADIAGAGYRDIGGGVIITGLGFTVTTSAAANEQGGRKAGPSVRLGDFFSVQRKKNIDIIRLTKEKERRLSFIGVLSVVEFLPGRFSLRGAVSAIAHHQTRLTRQQTPI